MKSLYPYQESVRTLLREGKNVIIQAPTGAGKTLAALYPYFENLDHVADVPYPADAPLPVTGRYAVPMRVLAAQFEREYRDYFSRLDRRRGTRFQDVYGKLGIPLPAIQTGETPQDPRFESPLTFCTIDQLLASFIGTPYSLGPGQANLNVAATIGSYLILDEFHLYPLDSGGARLTALAMLRLLKGFCRFTLMTATLSTRLLGELAKLLDAEVVRVEDDSELATIMRGRQRTIRRADQPMTAEAIRATHLAARERHASATLVVCNTVGRAQQMYSQLRDLLAREGRADRVRLQLLHSRFTPQHRQDKSERLESWLGDDAWHEGTYSGEDTIVVATQVVEVGLNISAGVLHTEVAPASSVIQRAGRCARFEQQQGEVIVYPIPPRDDNGNVSYRPYDQQLCEATWDALPTSSAPFGFTQEQALIDAVHTAEDTAFLNRFQQSETKVKEFIKDTLTSHEPEHRSKLIRDVASASVLIHPIPEDAITVKPFEWEAFALHPGILQGAWDALQQRARALDLPWVMKELVAGGDLGAEPDNDREQPYSWQPVPKEKLSGALRLVLPPQLATYDEQLGFRLLLGDQDPPGTWQSERMEKQSSKRDFAKREQRSYVEHISGLMAAYDWSVRRELAWVASRLEPALIAPAGNLDLAVRLAIACHDIGKLGDDWQRWAHATQAALTQRYGTLYEVQPGREFLAKTDALDSRRREEEKAVQASLRQRHIARPPHACAGVLAGGQLIARRFLTSARPEQQLAVSALTRATLTAIAHHHAPTATTYDAISWREGPVREVLTQAFSACRLSDVTPDALDLASKPSGQLPVTYLVAPAFDTRAECHATWLAFTLVRALRLCDQRAERDW